MDVTFKISGIRNSKGAICGLAFTEDNGGFPDGVHKAYAQAMVDAQKGSVLITFKGLKVKKAAFVFFHDEKRIGRVEKGFLGIPKQGITASNWNGRSRPRYSSSLIALKPMLEAKLKYF